MENIDEIPPVKVCHYNEHQTSCFLCWRGTQDGLKLEPLHPLKASHHNIHPSQVQNLKRDLSVIFLLRKVLGLPQHLLVTLLENCAKGSDRGNPAEWGIKLCVSCRVILKEADFLHRRVIKMQADFQEVAKEIRDILVGSESPQQERETEMMPNLDRRKARRRPGRPASKKGRALLKSETGNKEDDKMEATFDPVRFLRAKFIQYNQSNTLDISPPKMLFTISTKGTGGDLPFINGLQTSTPVQVNVKVTTQDFLKANGVPSVTLPPLQRVGVTNSTKNASPCPLPDNFQAPPTVTSQEEPSAWHIKQEVHLNNHDSLNNELHNFDNLDNLVLSPPPPEDDPEWAPDDDLHQDRQSDHDSDNREDPTNDSSDFTPSPSKKRDKRFTRKKPNLKENQRRKDLRSVKAVSLSKAPTEASPSVEPLKITDEMDRVIYKCPQENCENTFSKKFECHVHLLKDHFEDPMPYHCHVCTGKRFFKESYFRKHMVRYHLSARSPYDSDYDPSLHSASHLKSLIAQDLHTNDPNSSENSEDESKTPGIPRIPPEILEKFKATSEGSPFSCSHCSRKFSNEMLRDGHEKRVHLGIEKPFSCTLCPLAFCRRTRLLEHLTLVHFSNQHACPQCGARFADKVLLAGHIGRAHLGEKNPFKCPHCPSRFIRRTKMDVHMFKKHGIPLPKGTRKRKIPARCIPLPKLHPSKAKKGVPVGTPGEIEPPPPKKCWMCYSTNQKEGSGGGGRLPMLFDTVEDLKEHNELNHKSSEDNPKPFKCPVKGCPREYRTHATLDFHMMNIHEGQIKKSVEEGAFKCHRCKASYHRGDLLDQHMAREHQIGMYICNFCAKQFRTPRYLEDHQRQSHYKELKIDPPFKCKYCGRVMNTAKSLDHHIKMVHLKNTPFKCTAPGCSFHAMYESSFKMHLQIKHSNKKNAICPVCSRTFAAEWYLNKHMLVHTGEKPYKCGECGKDFSDLSTFSRHKEAHLGRVHKCTVEGCGREYKTRHAWRIHLKGHRRRGLEVEIPKVRYQTEEEDERGKRLLEEEKRGLVEVGKTKVEELVELPVLEEEEKMERGGNFEGLPPVLQNEDFVSL